MTDDIGKDLGALRPLPARLAELTSDLRKLATCGQPTCLERRALSMLEELGLELAQPGANVVEFDKYEPSAGEVLRLLADWREAAERRKALKQRGKVDLAMTSLVNELELRVTNLDPAHLRALTIPDNAVPGMAGILDKPVIPVKPEREMLAGLASSMAADIAYFELQAERCLAEGEAETAARYQARLRVLRPYLTRIEGLMEFARLTATAPAEVAQ